MVNLEISEEAGAALESAAQRVGLTRHVFADEILRAHLAAAKGTSVAQALTPTALARLEEGFHAASNGEIVPQDEVEAFFDDWERELHA